MNDLVDPFESPKLLIDGAEAEIAGLQVECTAFIESCNCIPIEKPNPRTGGNVIKLHVTDKIPPRFRYTTSNILNNLRHSLDQAINCGAVELGAERRDSYFPFEKDLDKIPLAIKSRCKAVDRRLTDYIVDEYQPYGGGDDFLYAMSAATGPNKHQVTLSLESHLRQLVLGTSMGVEFTGPGSIGYFNWDRRKQELEFARLGRGAVLKLTGKPHLPIFVAIGEVPALGTEPVADVLEKLARKVRTIVKGIEAETGRLKMKPR